MITDSLKLLYIWLTLIIWQIKLNFKKSLESHFENSQIVQEKNDLDSLFLFLKQ